MPGAEAFGSQCSVLAASHRCVRLGQRFLQHLLVWHTACETQAILSGCEPDRGHDNSLHPVVESTLLQQQGYIVHEEDKSGKVEVENEREGSAVHAGQGYDPNLG